MKHSATLLALVPLSSAPAGWVFEKATVDDAVGIGYGIVLEDVNGDGKKDILLADKDRFVWYENPSWAAHPLTGKLTPEDHVCLAARDLDGDGKAEIAVGAGWNPSDTVNSGAVFSLSPGTERTAPWTATALPHQPTVHRMHWVAGPGNTWGLVVAPLHPNGSLKATDPGSRIEWYAPPATAGNPWKVSLIDDSLQRTHNLDPVAWDGDPEEEILIAGLEGVLLADRKDGQWVTTPLLGKRAGDETHQGAGEVRAGRASDGSRFIATIEPMHGNQLALYRSKDGTTWTRSLIREDLLQGHALACAPMRPDAGDQVVFGWRGNGKAGDSTGVMIFDPMAETDAAFHMVDDAGMSCEDLRLADLDGDGRIDIVAAGRATKNLVIYWNKSTW
jgi:hypothetical protein